MCKFCEEYEIMKEISLQSKYPVSFSAALIDHMIVRGEPKGRTTHYMKDGVGFPLNFCPECGKKLVEDCKVKEDCIPTPHLIDATTSQDIDSGRYPVYVLGIGVSEDDLTHDERTLFEQSKKWIDERGTNGH